MLGPRACCIPCLIPTSLIFIQLEVVHSLPPPPHLIYSAGSRVPDVIFFNDTTRYNKTIHLHFNVRTGELGEHGELVLSTMLNLLNCIPCMTHFSETIKFIYLRIYLILIMTTDRLA